MVYSISAHSVIASAPILAIAAAQLIDYVLEGVARHLRGDRDGILLVSFRDGLFNLELMLFLSRVVWL